MKKLELQHEDIRYVGKAEKGKQRFLVTAAVAGAPVHKEFLKNCEDWCKVNKAELVIISCRSHAQAFEAQVPIFDSVLDNHFVDGNFVREYKINSNLKIIDAQQNPQLLNPQNGLHKFGNVDTKFSVIVGHPSQNATTIASGNTSHPRRVLCTGVLTKPNYRNNTYGRLAEKHHIIGALVVEVLNDKIFFTRQIQSKKDGSFYLNNTLYGGKTKLVGAKNILVLGDLHPELIDKDCLNSTLEQIKFFKPEKIVLHDYIDNQVVNGHIKTNYFKKSQLSTFKIEDNIKDCVNVIMKLRDAAPNAEIVFVASNHGDRLDRYIENGEYAKDYVNFKFLHEAVLLKLNNPMKSIYEFLLKIPGKTKFLIRKEDYFYAGHNLAFHGDVGLAGKGGSLETFNRCVGKCVIGHHHAHGILGQAKQVGHNSQRDHGYNQVLNYWTHGNLVLYEDGSYSELIIVNGEWRLK